MIVWRRMRRSEVCNISIEPPPATRRATRPSGGLPREMYKLFAIEFIDSGAALNPEFFRLYEARGNPARFRAGGKQQAQVMVLPRAR